MVRKALCLLSLVVCSLQGATPKFVVLVTSYNNEQYVDKNLSTLFTQTSSEPVEVLYVDDASTDKTYEKVCAFKEHHNLTDQQLRILRNKKRVGSGLANIYNTVHNHIDDHSVVVCVDGDDWLPGDGIFQRLEQEYADPHVWMTFGKFLVYPEMCHWEECAGYDADTIEDANFRDDLNVPSHLKTFYARLFKQIRREDLIDDTGDFYKIAWDMAMLFPMLEMCAPTEDHPINHSSYIGDTVMYIYNFANPLSDYVESDSRAQQVDVDLAIREKRHYKPLITLFPKE